MKTSKKKSKKYFPNGNKKQGMQGGWWKQYPAYKDSGVEWLGQVPEHWVTWKVTHGFQRLGSGTTPKSDDLQYYNGEIPWVTTSELRETVITDTNSKLTEKALEDYSSLHIYPPETLLFAMYGATIGRMGILEIHATVNQACCAFTGSEFLDPKFTFYWLWMRRPILIALSSGGGQPNLSQDDLRSVRIPAPPISEQRAIAAFLDHETGSIDALIGKKERQIELLQEKRTALISHAVTKGLDPDAPMKDSGVEWLGEVPERWRVKQFKRVTTRVDVGIAEAATHAYADEGVPIIRSTNVRPGRILMDDLLYIQEWFAEKNRSKYLFANDLLTVRTGAPGTTAVIPPELHECQCFTMLISTLKTRQIPQFYTYFLNSSNARFRFAVEGWGTAQINISVPILQQQIIAEPPENEQRAIATFLDHETGHIDVLTTKVRESIAKLREYRTTLISAAVTGKIDVRSDET